MSYIFWQILVNAKNKQIFLKIISMFNINININIKSTSDFYCIYFSKISFKKNIF